MIETRVLSIWDGLVGSGALIALVVLALSVMVRAVKLEEVPRHLAVTTGIVILLIMLPAIIVSVWNLMTLEQHLGVATIFIATIFLISATQWKSRKARH